MDLLSMISCFVVCKAWQTNVVPVASDFKSQNENPSSHQKRSPVDRSSVVTSIEESIPGSGSNSTQK
eukprot:scaffold14099_cov71-Skeletonema_dohrnii-CCMP3373.AAC.1